MPSCQEESKESSAATMFDIVNQIEQKFKNRRIRNVKNRFEKDTLQLNQKVPTIADNNLQQKITELKSARLMQCQIRNNYKK